MSPAGPAASQLDQLAWTLYILGGAIGLLVIALLVFALFYRPSEEDVDRDRPFGTPLLWIGGIALPLLVLGFVLFLTVRGMVAASSSSPPDLTIQVVGHQWWWEARYPNANVTTANEIHIPVGQRVQVQLTSDDVIHDFSVPQLQGKIDAIPGETNTIWLQASQAGRYRGECLVYCGLQHANMLFFVVAEPPDQFDTWLSQQSTTPPLPTDTTLLRGRQVFMSSACTYCHTIDGTSASGTIGPNLTHLASRSTIAAGTLPNTPGALGGWIVDPQTIKPGNLMPPERFSSADLQALIAYLDSLK